MNSKFFGVVEPQEHGRPQFIWIEPSGSLGLYVETEVRVDQFRDKEYQRLHSILSPSRLGAEFAGQVSRLLHFAREPNEKLLVELLLEAGEAALAETVGKYKTGSLRFSLLAWRPPAAWVASLGAQAVIHVTEERCQLAVQPHAPAYEGAPLPADFVSRAPLAMISTSSINYDGLSGDTIRAQRIVPEPGGWLVVVPASPSVPELVSETENWSIPRTLTELEASVVQPVMESIPGAASTYLALRFG